MQQNRKSDQGTQIHLGSPDSFEEFALSRVTSEGLAERIAAALDERRRIGELRRQREREYRLREAERAQAIERRRGEAKGSDRRIAELDALCQAVSCSNAADAAMKEFGIINAAENAGGTVNGGAFGHACI